MFVYDFSASIYVAIICPFRKVTFTKHASNRITHIFISGTYNMPKSWICKYDKVAGISLQVIG